MIRKTNVNSDKSNIYALYKEVAKYPGGIARLEHEITEEYVYHFLNKADKQGLSMVKEFDSKIVGEIHAYSPGLYCFSHVLGDLTIVIHPDYHSKGFGRELFTSFMNCVEKEFTGITRIELISRESNKKAIRFYESIGFSKEGKLEKRIKNLDGSFESDIPMARNIN